MFQEPRPHLLDDQIDPGLSHLSIFIAHCTLGRLVGTLGGERSLLLWLTWPFPAHHSRYRTHGFIVLGGFLKHCGALAARNVVVLKGDRRGVRKASRV